MARYFTPEGFEKIKKELEYLKNIKLKELSNFIKEVVSSGQLKEKTASDEIQIRRTLLQAKISELEEKIRNAKIVTKKPINRVQIGSTVLVSLNDEEKIIRIVGAGLVNSLKDRISYESPLGRAILGKSAGDTIKIDIENNKITCKIIKIC